MKVVARIKRQSDGAVAEHETDWGDGFDPSNAEYMWTDGNYGCNCNRQLFFARARGEAEDNELICGQGWFLVQVWADGELVVDEWSTK